MKKIFFLFISFSFFLYGQAFGEYYEDSNISTNVLYNYKKNTLLFQAILFEDGKSIWFEANKKSLPLFIDAVIKAKEWNKIAKENSIQSYAKYLFKVKVYDAVMTSILNIEPLQDMLSSSQKRRGISVHVYYTVMPHGMGISFRGDEVFRFSRRKTEGIDGIFMPLTTVLAGKRNLLKEFKSSYNKDKEKNNSIDNLFK